MTLFFFFKLDFFFFLSEKTFKKRINMSAKINKILYLNIIVFIYLYLANQLFIIWLRRCIHLKSHKIAHRMKISKSVCI